MQMAPVRLAQEEAVQAQGYGDMTIGDLVKVRKDIVHCISLLPR